jgi:hypothetical protein
MYSLVRIVTCCSLIMLSGCAHYNSYKHQMQERAVCREACHEQQRLCHKVCYNNCPFCCERADGNAEIRYKKYKQQQRMQGSPVIRQLKSYRDPLQCRKTSCDCVTDHAVCLQSCTGKLPKKLQIAPAC